MGQILNKLKDTFSKKERRGVKIEKIYKKN